MQLDEKWSFVEKKQKHCDPTDEADWFRGDQWDHVALDPDSRLVIHHARGSDAIATHILSDGSSLRLDPPGLEMAVAEFFPVAEPRA